MMSGLLMGMERCVSIDRCCQLRVIMESSMGNDEILRMDIT